MRSPRRTGRVAIAADMRGSVFAAVHFLSQYAESLGYQVGHNA